MELTNYGRALSMKNFYDNIKSDGYNTLWLGQPTEWPSGVPVFNPTTMMNSAALARTVCDVSIIYKAVSRTPVPGASTIQYNGETFYVVSDMSDSNIIVNIMNSGDFLLYINITLEYNSSKSASGYTFRQLGFSYEGSNSNTVVIYENFVAQSVTPGSTSLDLSLVLAF